MCAAPPLELGLPAPPAFPLAARPWSCACALRPPSCVFVVVCLPATRPSPGRMPPVPGAALARSARLPSRAAGAGQTSTRHPQNKRSDCLPAGASAADCSSRPDCLPAGVSAADCLTRPSSRRTCAMYGKGFDAEASWVRAGSLSFCMHLCIQYTCEYTLCYALMFPGRKSAFRAGFGPVCYREISCLLRFV